MWASLDHFDPISLEEMGGIRLMNRTDTKFVTTVPVLERLLRMAEGDYRVQDVGGVRLAPYYTVYFDTPAYDMFLRHEKGHAGRQKLRIRSYVSSGLSFLEVKTKDNHGRTRKRRMGMDGFDALHPAHDITFAGGAGAYAGFLASHLRYDAATLRECVENRFDRITLVNRAMTERLTIDTSLRVHNLATGLTQALPAIAIIELKRDGRAASPVLDLLRRLRVKPMGFSKYCLGSAMTNPDLPRGRIKARLHAVERLEACSS